jgi:hypothetical protein
MRHCKPIMLAVFTLALTFFAMPRTVRAQSQYDIQVGAWGDDASKGNMGAGAEIRTNITPPTGQDLAASFWVGDNLQNDAFIQFGYQLTTPGNFCVYGETIGDQGNCLGSPDNVGYGDARWFWEYWPNPAVMDFYYAIGPANSAGPDGAWHLYQILPSATKGWDFVLDGHTVWSFNMFQVTKSKDPPYMVAEEVTSTQSASGSLGPVEFRNLSYLDGPITWQSVTSLSAISGCGGVYPNCSISIPYGVTVLGPNDIIAGTGEQFTKSGSLLWPRTFTLTVSAPSQAWVIVDGLPYAGGLTSVPLLQGSHSISVPEIVGIDSMNRLRFDGWSDGSTALNRVINMSSDTNLQATYVEQYKLAIVSPFPISVDGWYDQGISAAFKTDTTPHITNTLGVMIFVGWYNQHGALVTGRGGGSIVMDGPNTLEARWLTLNSFIPIVLAALSTLVIVSKLEHVQDVTGQIELQDKIRREEKQKSLSI